MTGTSGMGKLETSRLSPEMRLKGLGSIIAGKQVEQRDRQLDISQQQANTSESTGEARIRQLNSVSDYYDWKATGGDENKRTTITTIPIDDDTVQKAIVDAETGEVIRNLGPPVMRYKNMESQEQERTKRNVVRDARNFAAAETGRMLGLGVQTDSNGNVTVQFQNPEGDAEVYNEILSRQVHELARIYGVPIEELTPMLSGKTGDAGATGKDGETAAERELRLLLEEG